VTDIGCSAQRGYHSDSEQERETSAVVVAGGLWLLGLDVSREGVEYPKLPISIGIVDLLGLDV